MDRPGSGPEPPDNIPRAQHVEVKNKKLSDSRIKLPSLSANELTKAWYGSRPICRDGHECRWVLTSIRRCLKVDVSCVRGVSSLFDLSLRLQG